VSQNLKKEQDDVANILASRLPSYVGATGPVPIWRASSRGAFAVVFLGEGVIGVVPGVGNQPSGGGEGM
jgi:hypothetical protein